MEDHNIKTPTESQSLHGGCVLEYMELRVDNTQLTLEDFSE